MPTDDTKAETVAVQASERKHAVESAGYWFNESRRAETEDCSLADALHYMEQAYNHTENALVALRKRVAAPQPSEDEPPSTWRFKMACLEAENEKLGGDILDKAITLADALSNQIPSDAAVSRASLEWQRIHAAYKVFRKALAGSSIAAMSPRPQAGMISADRACEIIKDMIDDGGASIGDLNEASRTIRMEASPRQDVKAEAALGRWAQEYLERASKAETRLAALQSDFERAIEALKGLLLHAGIADAAPEDVDEEDRALERRARAIISQAQAQKGGE